MSPEPWKNFAALHSGFFFYENPNSFYSPTIEHINEILMLNTIPMDFYEWKAIDQFFCVDMEEDMRRAEAELAIQEGLAWDMTENRG